MKFISKNQKNKKFINSPRIHATKCGVQSNEDIDNATIIGAVCVISFLLLFLASFGHTTDLLYRADHSDVVKNNAKAVESKDSVYKEIGDAAFIDGSLRVFETNSAKVFDLVEVSTPVTPAANHMRLFLRADGTKQSLVAQWDDGTTSRIAGN